MRRESRFTRWLWLPLNALQLAFTLIWSAFWITVALLVSLLARESRVLLWLARRVWAPGLLYGAGARLVVRGLAGVDLSRSYLVVANHSSWIDIPVLLMAFPVPLHFLAKRELAAVPFLGWYIRAMGMVFVDRRDPRRAHASVGSAQRLLLAGRNVVSFPEGTRARDGRIGPFKVGGFGAALAAGAEVLPVALVGAGDVLPADGFRVRPGRIEVRIGTALSPPAPGPHARAELAASAREAVLELAATEP